MTDQQRDELKKELMEEGLRLAAATEAGWYYTTSAGKVWVTDEDQLTHTGDQNDNQ